MTLKSVMLQLSDDQISELDRAARQQGVSRSQMVRNAVDALINPPDDPDIAAAYAAAYPTASHGADDWGDLDDWHRAAADAQAADSATVPAGRDSW